MTNEIILVSSLIVLYGAVVLFYRFFGKNGLYVWTAIATIAANIEVLILVDAFGMEQTLGNILFATTFLVTDILSENEGKKAANKAVIFGISTSLAFILISQSWLIYQPAAADWVSPAIRQVFANTPRMMLVGITVYAIVQIFDVWAYHAIWSKTTKHFGNSRKYLWIRNNGSTMISQLLNTVLFNVGAFYGTYDTKTLVSICVAGYIIYMITSLFDTPAVYIARRLKENGKIKE